MIKIINSDKNSGKKEPPIYVNYIIAIFNGFLSLDKDGTIVRYYPRPESPTSDDVSLWVFGHKSGLNFAD